MVDYIDPWIALPIAAVLWTILIALKVRER